MFDCMTTEPKPHVMLTIEAVRDVMRFTIDPVWPVGSIRGTDH